MNDNDNFTVQELLEEAKNDPSWESDPEERATLTEQLKRILNYI